MRLFLSVFMFFVSLSAWAQNSHDSVRRIVVFPFKVEATLTAEAEASWWDLRERLTESRRFLVASKNFMQAKDVFQPRGELKPADAIILGRLLEANALITIYVVGHKMSMRVYESLNGQTLWASDIELHTAIPVSKQLKDNAKKLLYDFIATIPYQGYVVVDKLIGRPSYAEGSRLLFKADVGVGSQATVGDTVELVRIKAERLAPLFQEGLNIEAYAEGVIVSTDRNIITVQVTRKVEGEDILEDALVRIPQELKRLKEIYGIKENLTKNMQIGLFKHEIPPSEKELETKPLVTSLAWLTNFALLLFLAF